LVTAFIIPSDTLIKRLALEFKTKKIITPPEWSAWVKTGHFKEDKPLQEDWFYIRSAAVLRKIYIRGPVGVQGLRKLFGTRKNRGSSPNKASFASGAVIRNIIQQLEKAGLVEPSTVEGRVVSIQGKKFVDTVCKDLKDSFPELKEYI
jgi:small subunit ribosomal protein S19e